VSMPGAISLVARVSFALALFVLAEHIAALGFRLPALFGLCWMTVVAYAFVRAHVPLRSLRNSAGMSKWWENATAIVLVRTLSVPVRWAAFAAVAFLVLRSGLMGVVQFFAKAGPVEELWLPASPGRAAMVILFSIGITPLVEEFCFRGWIQGSLLSYTRPRAAIVVAAMFFAAAHVQVWGYGPVAFVSPFLMGLLFGVSVHVAQSIWAGVIAHAFVNATVVVMAVMDRADLLISGWEHRFGLPAAVVFTATGVLGLTIAARRISAERSKVDCTGSRSNRRASEPTGI